jgi:predicted PolB exonuclease-like 3'-5' exonuclease
VNSLTFDIETVPDVELGRKLFGLQGISDEDVAKAMMFRQLQLSGNDFLPLYQHRVVAISVVLSGPDDFRVWSLGDADSEEGELVQRFFDGIDKYSPELVSWNGSGFDLPVLHYRSLKHGVQSPRYWETGDEDRSFRYNNYLGRFHWRHIDLMDVLSGYQPRSRAGLDAIATMLGFPGKMGMKGDQVSDAYLRGEIDQIRNYCETDALNTYLIYLRFQFIRGLIDEHKMNSEYGRVRDTLQSSDAPHLHEFISAWPT